MRIILFKKILILFLFLSFKAFAQENSSFQAQTDTFQDMPSQDMPSEKESSPEKMGELTSYQGAFTKMMLSLLALIVLIVISVWILKRVSHGRMRQLNSGHFIKILERRPLSAKSILYLIEINGKKVVIAESQFEIRPITTAEEQISTDEN